MSGVGGPIPARPAEPAPAEPGDVLTYPAMFTLTEGFIIKKPESEAAPPVLGAGGSVSVGAGHLPGVGGIVYIAFHHPAGDTLVAAMGVAGGVAFADALNSAFARVAAAEFDQPERAQ